MLQATEADFSELARMLRGHLNARRLKKKHALELLDVLEAKADRDDTRLRIARNLRQDWERVGGGAPQVQVTNGVRVLPWVVLPPGTGQARLQHLLASVREFAKRNPEIRVDASRIPNAYKLGPKEVYVGQDHFDGYFVFLFKRTPRVLLEHPIEGNAAYVLFQDWKRLSMLTKAELLDRKDSRRVVHNGDWKNALKKALRL